jgi:prepilin-type N-terminal cleavage/methylation domain-containing protein
MSTGRSRGFTLVEAITAIVVLSIAVPGMVWALREAHRQRVSPALISKARWLATERLEDILADRHSTTRGYAYVVNANYSAEVAVSGFTQFGRNVSITESGVSLSGAGTGYKTVTVTVLWNEGASAKSLAISTVVTDY